MRRMMMALLLLLALIVPGVGKAQFYPGRTRDWGPRGNGMLDHEDDLRWVFFHDAKIAADQARGVYTATFPPALRQEDGVDFTITGYMLPIEATSTAPHFVLTRRSTGCPFCPPNEPTEAIEVFATRPVAYTQGPVMIRGTLRLVASSARGLFFQLHKAKVL